MTIKILAIFRKYYTARKHFSNLLVYKSVILLMLLLIFGCAHENPALVSPVPPSKTVTFRLINYCANPSTLVLGETVSTPFISQNGISDPFQPPMGDSISIELKEANSLIYKSPFKFRLVRDTRYFLVSFPKPTNLTMDGSFNALGVITTTLTLLLNDNKSYLSVVNAFPDSTVNFNVTIGCPNGSPLAQNILYRNITASNEISAGPITISLVENANGTSSLVELYDFNLTSKSEYALIIRPDGNGIPELWALDMNSMESKPLQKAVVDTGRATYIRSINFSNSPITLAKVGSDVIGNLSPLFISPYTKISSCTSNSQDIIASISGADTNSLAFSTLQVNKNYSVMVFDSADKKGGLTVIAEPVTLPAPLGSNCVIRVVHAAYSASTLTVSMGAKYDNSSVGYRSGDVLASKITYGSISQPVIIPAGRAPVTLFTSNQPPQLLLPALPDNNLEAGKFYLLIITNDNLGFCHLNIIEDNDQNTAIDSRFELKKGVFTQVVNSNPDNGTLTLGLQDINSAKVYYKGFLSTVLPAGSSTLTVNGSQNNFNIDDANKRGLLIIGSGNTVYNMSGLPIGSGYATYRARFINISSKTINCMIETYNFSDTLNPATASPNIFSYNLTGKVSISFADMAGNSLYRLDGVDFSFGLNYEIIFDGKSAIIKSEF